VNLPSLIYGVYAETARRCRRSVSALQAGQPWEQVTEAPGFLDTHATDGLIILHGPSPLLKESAQFHVYLLHSLVRAAFLEKKMSKQLETAIFEASLRSPWAILGLLAEPSLGFLYPPERHRPFLRAVLDYWDIYRAEGPRFSDGRDWGIDLWSAQGNLQYVLINLGAPQAAVAAFNPSGDLRNLIADAGLKL